MRQLFLFVCSVVLLLCMAPTADAQYAADSFSIIRFRPPIGVHNYLQVESARLPGHRAGSFGIHVDYGTQLLTTDQPCSAISDVVINPNDLTGGSTDCFRSTNLISAAGVAHLSGGLALHNRVLLGLSFPFGITGTNSIQGRFMDGSEFIVRPADPTFEIEPANGFAPGDPRLSAKIHLLGEQDQPLHVAALVHTTVPFSRAFDGECDERGGCHFLGEKSLQAGALFISEFAVANFSAAANVGATFRPEATFLTETVGSEIQYGVAGQYRPLPFLGIVAEINGAITVLGGDQHPAEIRGGLQIGQWDVTLMLGGGFGFVEGPGGARVRAFGGVSWTPTRRDADADGVEDDDDACPDDPEDRDGFMDGDGCPETDNDGDGIEDSADKCPSEPEDEDNFKDEDGCPDPDNDEDGVPDGYDSCEGEKEDMDGDRDSDGCPDLDTDRDGIMDDVDQCKDDPEDRDGLGDEDGCPEEDFDGDGLNDEQDSCPDEVEIFNGLEDEDGCPELDRDRDTVPDPVDRCRNAAETLNGASDGDGCPDGRPQVVVQGQLIVPVYQPRFEVGIARLSKRRTFQVLDTIVGVLKRIHQKGGVRVVAIAPKEDTEALSRAEAVAAYLRGKGVDAARLSAARIEGSPARIEVEMLGPGQKALKRPEPEKTAPAPAAEPPKATGKP